MRIIPIVVGVTVDVAGSFTIGLSYFVALSVWAMASGSAAEVMPEGSWPASLLEHVGLLATALGGYVPGRFAADRPVHHGAAVGLSSLPQGGIRV